MKYQIKEVHISTIVPGDTVEHCGKLMTVCKKDIVKGGFMGTTIFGDSYRQGIVAVKKVIIERAIPS